MDVLNPDKKLNFPKSVVEMMQGLPRSARRRLAEGAAEDHSLLRRREAMKGRPGEKMPKVDFDAVTKAMTPKHSEPHRSGRAQLRDVSAGVHRLR